MDIWVAGATGVLGRSTVRRLLSAGHAVTGLARSTAKWPDAPQEMRFIPCDVTSTGAVLRAFSESTPDVIIHMASATPEGKPTPRTLEPGDNVRRFGTENLLEMARTRHAFFVLVSTHHVAEPRGETWIDESSKVAGSPLTESAVDAERYVRQAIIDGQPACVVRPATIYSPESSQTRAVVEAVRAHHPILIGKGDNYWSLIRPEDVATALAKVVELRPVTETFYIADDEPVMMGDLLRWLAQSLHVPPPRSFAPMLARVAVGSALVDMLTASRRISNAKAKRELDWSPAFPTYREGMTDILKQTRHP